ncbi:MBL fold metallo-hydrolase [Nevskia ramosa]|uniref:MBL fold metallo-hydrolase n=1 Tax=Nevskia ramosa TaxID=64002 RepID=UPI0003B76D23|nr:MBL fold metallo-hydrolase [Nevskia ramosa]
MNKPLQLGDARIHRIEEWSGLFMTPQTLFAGFDAADYARVRQHIPPAYLNLETDSLLACLQSFVIELDGRRILIDTGAGNDKDRPGIPLFARLNTPFLKTLEAAGFTRESIDLVICTHLHVDHVGWNTMLQDDTWVPTFPNAKYVFTDPDAEYWDPQNRSRFPNMVGEQVNAGFFEDSVRPILDRGLAQIVRGPTILMDGLRLDPAPGHTPGSQTITVESRGQRATFVGDIVHHPLQVFCPTWNSIFCENADQARATRSAVLERVAHEEAIMIPAHFAGNHMVRVSRISDGFAPQGL